MGRLRQKRHTGFTLVELLVVIAIIGILVALLLPAVQAAREAARRTQCANNVKQIGLALQNYHGTYHVLPPGGVCANETGWQVFILPFIERQDLFNEFNFNAGAFTSGTGQVGRNAVAFNRVAAYLCPSSPANKMQMGGNNNVNSPELINGQPPYTTHYYGVMGPKGTNPNGAQYGFANGATYGGYALDGVFGRDSRYALRDVTDGTSNTFMVGEVSWVNQTTGTRYRSWMRGCQQGGSSDSWIASCRNVNNSINTPSIALFNDIAFGSMHPNGTHFLLCDASVRFISQNVNLGVYKATASRNGGEAEVVQ
jgi:prepilin-type N-terminal cleavage/methylation domain-containing protein